MQSTPIFAPLHSPVHRQRAHLGNAARNNLAAVLEDFPIPVAIFAIGIMRHSTPFPMVGRVLRPDMIIGVNLDTLYCATFRAHEGAKARLAAPGRNISHHFHPPAALLAGRV
jgi:hypothetical protein